ncbi:helix-turn-helix domain-containing protein [Massilia sp. DJPM01]|uniref:helix-turn-helix domain-containing protein n=1 Tax=Massilia sp. DJPM01 TaxID=3024404 RepID=UPI00259E5B66|nr:helix-turn-helix domain-containing protein [Massilia sp. DJPM01]MDM5182065.1 helix-turn-helix domain-containing protein [Massilia sp. DJPM01]
MHPSEQSASSQSIAAAVKDLMHRKQVPERQQSKKLGEILNLSYSQAHRKLNTGADWTIAQLQVVAEYFGESLASVGLGEVTAGSDGQPAGMMEQGLFVAAAGQHEYPCVMWVGEQLHTARRVDFVAYQDKEKWRVVETLQCPDNVVRYKVNKLEIVLKQPHVPTVAVVDDEQGFADNMRDFLNESGFKATVFYNATSIERVLHEGATFDGYILDWILGQRTAEGLIKQIRYSASPAAPIFLLTGEVASGLADEEELARVITQLDVQIREKPVRLNQTFTAELHKAFGA